MFKFVFAMIIPVLVFLYTVSFMRWLGRNHHIASAMSAGALAFGSLLLSGATLWRMLF